MVSFLLPFLGALGFCYFVLGWSLQAAQIGGAALSTTSVAVVYAVMVETGLNREDLGKLILAACFVTDLGTVLALGGLFASFGTLLVVFVAVSAGVLAVLPATTRFIIRTLGHRVSEPEIKLLLLVLLGLGALATAAESETVLPAYVAGLVIAGIFLHDRVLIDRMRSVAFALLTPFNKARFGVEPNSAQLPIAPSTYNATKTRPCRLAGSATISSGTRSVVCMTPTLGCTGCARCGTS